MKNRQYPIMLGMNPPTKQGIGIKSKIGSGYDLYILDNDLSHQYAQIHFCNKEAIGSMIKLLEDLKNYGIRRRDNDFIICFRPDRRCGGRSYCDGPGGDGER